MIKILIISFKVKLAELNSVVLIGETGNDIKHNKRTNKLLLLGEKRKLQHTPLPPPTKKRKKLSEEKNQQTQICGLNTKITMAMRSLNIVLRLLHG